MATPGLYIVTLRNRTPISVNAQDPRVASRAICVTYKNCKFGKAKSLEGRRASYERTFGTKNVDFHPIAVLAEIDFAEKAVLKRLDDYRIRGRTGRKNEWLEGIRPEAVHSIVLQTLGDLGLDCVILGRTLRKCKLRGIPAIESSRANKLSGPAGGKKRSTRSGSRDNRGFAAALFFGVISGLIFGLVPGVVVFSVSLGLFFISAKINASKRAKLC
ncbi:hypothetical protein BDD21_4583 [Thiocapsa rosea]|uniref:Uncharacterized protein n=1 Tax=Thiocapsa rosea TaxID=69360 RepID=A0A495VCP6_9GAMM|nr:hypothetical protein BDD21_4583 [Thiocapsa rosea]